MRNQTVGVIGIVCLGVFALTAGFGAAPSKKQPKSIKSGGKTQLEASKMILTRNEKGSAWIETEDMRITGNTITIFFQENQKDNQNAEVGGFDRIEAQGNVTLRASQPNATGNAPRKINGTCSSATITQKAEQIPTDDGTRAIRQKVVLRGNVKVTTELAPGGNLKGVSMEGNQVIIATKTDGEVLALADDAITEAIFEQ
jgi:lipopolysaccharide export system protein LptA